MREDSRSSVALALSGLFYENVRIFYVAIEL